MNLGVNRDKFIEALKALPEDISLNDVVYAFSEECSKENTTTSEMYGDPYHITHKCSSC